MPTSASFKAASLEAPVQAMLPWVCSGLQNRCMTVHKQAAGKLPHSCAAVLSSLLAAGPAPWRSQLSEHKHTNGTCMGKAVLLYVDIMLMGCVHISRWYHAPSRCARSLRAVHAPRHTGPS